MKKYVFILVFIALFFASNKVFALDENVTTVGVLLLNGIEEYDIELLLYDSKIYLPIKQLAKICEVPIEINHSTKEIKLKNANFNKKGIFLNGVLLDNSIKFQKNGIITNDEYYIKEESAKKIFNLNIKTDLSNLSVSVEDKNLIKLDLSEDNKETKEKEVYIEPRKKGKISFDTLELSNSAMSDSTKQVYLNSRQDSIAFNNNTRISLKGKLYKGDYSVNFNTNNYAEKFFSFGGLSFTYKNKFKNYFYELGQVSGFKNPSYSIGTMLIGAQISDYEDKKNTFNNNIVFLKKGETKQRAFVGVSGYNNRLFSQNGYIYQMTSKKFVKGISRQYGLRDNVLIDTKFINDSIIQKNDDALFYNYMGYNDYSILSSGIYKNPNTLEGSTLINEIKFKKNEKYALNLITALSKSYDYNKAQNNFGYNIALENVYDFKNSNLKFSLFQQSSDYYLAGSDAGFISDRLGARISHNYRKNDFSINSSYSRYYSNLNDTYKGGIISFDEAYLSIASKLVSNIKMRLNGNLRCGKNSLGHNLNYYYNLNFAKNLTKLMNLECGCLGNSYDTQYNSITNNGIKSNYNLVYLNNNIRLPKNKGSATIGHDSVSYESNGAKNDYNMIKLNYRFPEFKRILLGLGVGYKYQGLDSGLAYTLSLGYRTKTGMVIGVNYQYNSSMGYMFNNMYIPSSSRHSINFTINDAFAFSNGIQSIGNVNSNQGFVEIVAYMDKNKNNKFDKGDIRLSNVAVKVPWQNLPIYTKRSGFCPLQAVDEGVYEVGLDFDNIHTNLSSKKIKKEKIRVDKSKTTRIEFPLISSVGNVSGRLKIEDEFKRKMNIQDFVVVLNDLNNKEIAYSTVDKGGKYYFSGIEPGKYKLSLDKNLINDNNLIPDSQFGEINIDIPYVYKKFVTLQNMDLVYKCY